MSTFQIKKAYFDRRGICKEFADDFTESSQFGLLFVGSVFRNDVPNELSAYIISEEFQNHKDRFEKYIIRIEDLEKSIGTKKITLKDGLISQLFRLTLEIDNYSLFLYEKYGIIIAHTNLYSTNEDKLSLFILECSHNIHSIDQVSINWEDGLL